MLNHLINLNSPHIQAVLPILLKDQTTKRNIIWATDNYMQYAKEYYDDESELYLEISQITSSTLTALDKNVLQPRAFKSAIAQKKRTKNKAEVFTPSWLCNEMNNYADEQWFGHPDAFNKPGDTPHSWIKTRGKVQFPNTKGKTWEDYVYSTRLEITCGEAPYLVSRYDTTTGKPITVARRIGLLDRKLRVVNENTDTYEDWLFWTLNAYRATYGYEYQGDNLLIARINLLETFVDNKQLRWEQLPTNEELEQVATIISWNIWQMDGLTNCVPWSRKTEEDLWLMKCEATGNQLRELKKIQFETDIAYNVARFVYLVGHSDWTHTYTAHELIQHWTEEKCLDLIATYFAKEIGYDVKCNPKELTKIKKEHSQVLQIFQKRYDDLMVHLVYNPEECIIRKWSRSTQGKPQRWTVINFKTQERRTEDD